MRFQHHLPELSPQMLARFTQIDYDREMALIALHAEGDARQIVGVARFVPNPNLISAEFAIVVGDAWQGQGLGRALMTRPRLLMLDEPSLGLAPRVVEAIFGVFTEINRAGVAILLVEQNVRAALALAHRGYVLEHGRITGEGAAAALLDDPDVRRAYLGPLAVAR